MSYLHFWNLVLFHYSHRVEICTLYGSGLRSCIFALSYETKTLQAILKLWQETSTVNTSLRNSVLRRFICKCFYCTIQYILSPAYELIALLCLSSFQVVVFTAAYWVVTFTYCISNSIKTNHQNRDQQSCIMIISKWCLQSYTYT